LLGKDSYINDENLKLLIELRSKETVADAAQINVKLADGKNVFVKFDKTYQQVSGELSDNLFPPGVDPLDPLAVLIKTFSNSFTGKRLIITDN